MFEKFEDSQPRIFSTDFIFTLKFLKEKKFLGRKALSEALHLGEGSIRTILDKLKEEKLIESSPLGHFLTRKGEDALKAYRNFEIPKEVSVPNLVIGKFAYACLIKGGEGRVKMGIEQRDFAIIGSSRGATTLVFKGTFLFPDSLEKIEANTLNYLNNLFNPENGDVLVISSANSKENAFRGLMSSLRTFL